MARRLPYENNSGVSGVDKNTWAGSGVGGKPAQVFLFGKRWIDKKIVRDYSDKNRTGGPFAIVEKFQSAGPAITVALCLEPIFKVVGDIEKEK
jgi:hypothetical protein